MPLSPDTTLGPYKIVDELGAGGMGVWRELMTQAPAMDED